LRAIGDVLAERFELVGLFGVDFVLNGDEVWTVEVNPRYTASVEIIERATGVRAIELHARACKGESVDVKRAGASSPQGEIVASRRGEAFDKLSRADAPARLSTTASVHGKAILFARQDIIVSERFAKFALGEATNSPWPTLADISPAGTPIDADRPVLTVFVEGATTDEVERWLRSRVAEIEKRLYESEAPS
jgi:predicted ATP-grasp superfamily ATP-dependent carboligase